MSSYTSVYNNSIKPAETQFKFTNFTSPKLPFDKLGVKGIYTVPGELGCKNDLSEMFFSESNIKRIQKKIKEEIFKRTCGKYRMDTDQDEAKLVIFMRNVYYEHARHLSDQLVRQTKQLNCKLINLIVPDMITEIKQHYGYLDDIHKPLQVIPRPMYTSSTGRTMLPGFSTTF